MDNLVYEKLATLRKSSLTIPVSISIIILLLIFSAASDIEESDNNETNHVDDNLSVNSTIVANLTNETIELESLKLRDDTITSNPLGSMGILSYSDNGSLVQSVDDCGVLNTTNAIYTLTSNVTSNITCFTILANNITLDGAGYIINYSANGTFGYGINITNFNFTLIKNAVIKEGHSTITQKHAIYLVNTDNFTLINTSIVTISGQSTVIYFADSNSPGAYVVNSTLNGLTGSNGDQAYLFFVNGNNNIIIESNNLTKAIRYGISSIGSNSIIRRNTFSGGWSGVIGSGGANSTISDNVFSITGYGGASSGDAIGLNGASNYLIINNTIVTSRTDATTGPAIYILNSNNTLIINNSVITPGVLAQGIYLSSGINNTLSGNSVNTSSTVGYVVIGSRSEHFNHSIDTSNWAEGLPVAYNFSLNNQVLYRNQDLRSTYGQIICAWCTNVTYNNINMSNDGITLLNTSNSFIINSNINTSLGYGIYLYPNSSYNVINNNTITTMTNSNLYGIYVSSSNYNNITNNLFNTSGTNSYGIYLNLNNYNNLIDGNYLNTTNAASVYMVGLTAPNINTTISRNTVLSRASGIQVQYTNRNTIVTSNNVNVTGSGVFGITFYQENSGASTSSTIANNIVNSIITGGAQTSSLEMSGSKNVLVSNNTITGTYIGIRLGNNDANNNLSFYNNTVLVNGSAFVLANYVHNFTFSDGVINSSSNNGDFVIASAVPGGIWNFTNVTRANGSAINVSWMAGGNGTLNSLWYLDIITNYTNGSLASNTNITTYDVNNIFSSSALSDSSGNTRQSLLEYVRNETSGTNITYYSNYTINVTSPLGVEELASSVNMSSNKAIYFTFDGTPPEVSLISPTPSNNTFQNITYLQINASIIEANLSSIIYNWNGSSYNLYDGSLIMMLGLNNYSAISENATLAADVSKYGNNVTCTSIKCPNLNTSGKYGGAYTFDGVNDVLNITGFNPSFVTNLTVSQWVRVNNITTSYTSFASSTPVNGADDYGNGFVINTGNAALSSFNFLCLEGAGFGGCSDQMTSDFAFGTWHHIVAVIGTGTNGVKLYVDGNLEGQKDRTVNTVINTSIVRVGARYYSSTEGGYFNGTLDDIKMWNRTLSASEIQEIYMSNLYKYNSTQWYFYINQTHNLTSGLMNGATYTYAVSSSDINANTNSTDTRLFTSDTSSPNATLLNPTNNAYSNSGSINFTANLSDNAGLKNATLYIYNSSGSLINSTAITNFVGNVINSIVGIVANLIDGIYTWFYDVFDLAGNRFATTNSTIIVDTVYPGLNFTSPTPSNNTGRSSSIIINASIYDINLANVTLNWNGTLMVFNSTNESLANLGNGNYTFTYNQTGLQIGITYYYNLTVVDLAGNTNKTETRIVKGNSDPSIVSVSISPNATDDLDPNITILFTVNASDTDNNLDSLVLSAGKQNNALTNYTMLNITAKGIYTSYNISFTPDEESNYTFRIIANDTENALATYETNLSVFYDYSWNASIGFSMVTGIFSQNKYIGNLTINNTGDYNLTVDYITDNSPYPTGLGLKYDDTYYIYPTFTISSNQSSKGSRIILINATFSPVNRTDSVTITLGAGAAVPTSRALNFSLVSFAGGPYFDLSIDDYHERVNQSSNFSLGGYMSNIGDNYAYNVSLNWSLPSGFNILDGNLSLFMVNLSSREQSVFYTNRSDLNISINSIIVAGEYTVYLSASGSNGTAIADEINKTINRKITVYCSITDSICGAGCTYLTNNTFYDSDCSAPSTTTTTSGGGGGGGGASVSSETVKSKADYTIVRGKENEIIVLFKNKYSNQSISNLKFSISGNIAKYIEPVPSKLDMLGSGQELQIRLRILSPTYIELGRQEIILHITGKLGDLDYREDRKIVLQVNALSKEDAMKMIDKSKDFLDKVNALGLNSTKLDLLLDESKKALDDLSYEKIQENYEIIKKNSESAIEAYKEINYLKELIRQANEKGINTDNSERLLKLAELSLQREDYEEAYLRSKQALGAYALEIKGEIGKLSYYLKNNPKEISLSVLALAILCFGTYKVGKLNSLKIKIRKLKEEEFILTELIKLVQKQTFKDKKMSMEEYREAMLQYEKKMASVIEELIDAETNMAHVLKFTSQENKLKSEKGRIMELVRGLQNDYLKKGKLETHAYELKIESYNRRLGEIEEKLAEAEANQALKNARIKKI